MTGHSSGCSRRKMCYAELFVMTGNGRALERQPFAIAYFLHSRQHVMTSTMSLVSIYRWGSKDLAKNLLLELGIYSSRAPTNVMLE